MMFSWSMAGFWAVTLSCSAVELREGIVTDTGLMLPVAVGGVGSWLVRFWG